MNTHRILCVVTLLFLSLFGTGCDEKKMQTVDAEAADLKPAEPVELVVDNLIEVARPEAFPLVAVMTRTVPQELSVNGSFAPDVSRTVPVTGLAGGRILEIHTQLGDTVKAGQLLLKIHSPDLIGAIADLKKAQADERLAQRQYDRAKILYDHGASPRKDFESAEDALMDAKAETERATVQVRLLSGDPKRLQPFIEVRAPRSGVVVEQNVAAGATAKSLDATPNLFTIADLSRVWLLCDVYENNLAWVKVGDFAQVRVNAYPDRTFSGRVGNIASLLDPNTRSAKVRIELDNPDGILRPGMFATAIFFSQTPSPQLVVPASAILRLHDKDWVFLPQGGNRFRRTEVQAGPMDGDGTQQILAGLQPGDRIARDALQLSAAAAEIMAKPPAERSTP